MLHSQNLAHEIRRTNRRLLDDIFADQMLPIDAEQTHNDPINALGRAHFFVIQIRGIPRSYYLVFGIGKTMLFMFFLVLCFQLYRFDFQGL